MYDSLNFNVFAYIKNVSPYFLAESVIGNQNNVIREQKLRKFKKSNPDTQK
mgnify:CR=1 FL=1